MSLFPEPKVRQDWISTSQFHPLKNEEVLGQVVAWTKESKLPPVLLLDLDSTLYEVGPRSYEILKEWMATPSSREFSKVRDQLAQLKHSHVGYSLKDTFANIGLNIKDSSVVDALKHAKAFWSERFFTSDYLRHDVAYEGAAKFAQNAYEAGADLIYLTGRDEPGMGKGTRARLIQDGFPFDRPRTHLLLKKASHLDDLDHKQKAADYIQRTGSLVASFENEPPNLVALAEIFPAAMHVFVDTIYSDRPAMPRKDLYRITGFLD